jgi:hypothetical protein
VVGEHLHIVLPLFFYVDYYDLLRVEGPLQKVVALMEASHLAEGPAFPQPVEVEPEFGVVHEILNAELA